MRRPIRYLWVHLPFVAAIALIPAAVLSAGWWWWVRAQAEAEVRSNQAAIVRTFAALQEARHRERLASVEALAAEIEVSGALRRPDRAQALVERARPLAAALRAWVVTVDGRLMASSPAAGLDGRSTIARPDGGGPYFREALQREAPVVSSLLEDPESGRPVVVIAAPVRQDGRVAAVAAMAFELDLFASGLVGNTPFTFGRLFMLDRAGNALHFDRLRGSLVIDSWRDWPLSSMPAEAGGSRVIAVAGEPRVVTWEPIPGLGMVVGMEARRLEVLAAASRPPGPPLLAAGTVAVLISVVAGVLATRFGAGQLDRLRRYLDALGTAHGPADLPPPRFRIRELAEVARHGQTMAGAIRQRGQQVEILRTLDLALARLSRPEEVIREAGPRVVSLLGFDAAAVLLLDADRKSLRLFHAVGLPEAVTSRLERVPVSAVVWARALIERRVVVLQTGSHPDEDASGVRPGLAAHGLGLVVSVPLLAFNDVHGVLTLASRRPLEPSAATLDLLASIGTQIAGALVHARQLEQRAHQERLAALGRLAAGIAHELKNPLAVIDARLQLLRRESDALGGPAARHLASLEEASEWMKRIMHGLSTYAKPARSEPQLLDARELLSATRELVAYDARKAGVTVEVEIQGEPPAVLADRSEMMQVLVNLATNAIQAMEPGGGRLTLRAAAAQDAAGRTATVIEVSDTGPGIPEDRRERIWEPFYTTKPDGTGLGLSIVRALVAKQPAAWIDMETRAGVGTTFRITLHASP